MSLVEVLPQVHSLSRVEKFQLIQLLAQDLADGENASGFQAGQSYPVWSPIDAYEAADVMLKALQAHQEATPDVVLINDEEKDKLARRKANLLQDPASGLSWEEVKSRVRSHHGR
jgi:putative addiction module component (TIGR02574 family)